MEPIIITAFWDVGRGKDTIIPRTNEKYYEEFKAWAKIKNRMIIYCDQESSKHILDIRTEYGLAEKTKIICIDDVFSIEPEIFKKMLRVEQINHNDFKYYNIAMSNNAKFDYAWFMKYWCIAESCKYLEPNDLIAWMDFGFNHINKCYSDMSEFDFLWDCPRKIDRVQLYSLIPVDDVSIIDVLQMQADTFMGVFHLVPVKYANEFWNQVKHAMETLLSMEVLDDDQMLLLLAYKSNPNIFSANISDWFLPLKQEGARHLSVNPVKPKLQSLKKMYVAINRIKQHINFMCRTYKRMKKYR